MLVVAASRPTSRQSSSFSASAHSAFGTRGSRSPASIETNDRDMSPMSGAARGAAYTSRMYAASIRARHPCALAASIGAARARSLLEHRKRTPSAAVSLLLTMPSSASWPVASTARTNGTDPYVSYSSRSASSLVSIAAGASRERAERGADLARARRAGRIGEVEAAPTRRPRGAPERVQHGRSKRIAGLDHPRVVVAERTRGIGICYGQQALADPPHRLGRDRARIRAARRARSSSPTIGRPPSSR